MEILIERYNLNEKEIKYLKKGLKGIKFKYYDSLTIQNSNHFNYNMEIIKEVLLNGNHICYL